MGKCTPFCNIVNQIFSIQSLITNKTFFKFNNGSNVFNFLSGVCFQHEFDYLQVKLSIYKDGKEKANIVFNATGATKMNWMQPSRIVSSTFNDIKNAPHDIFNIRGSV